MDTLKEKLAPVLKHGFWIACGSIAVIALIISFLSTSSIGGATKKNIDDIKQVKNSIQQLQSASVDAAGEGNESANQPFHPNERTHQETAKLIRQLKQKVLESWTNQYSKQQSVLVWPKDLSSAVKAAALKKLQVTSWEFEVDGSPTVISADTEAEALDQLLADRSDLKREDFEGKGKQIAYNQPIEVAIPFIADTTGNADSPYSSSSASTDDTTTTDFEEIADAHLITYGTYITKHVEKLAEVIGAEWKAMPPGQNSTETSGTSSFTFPMASTSPEYAGEAGPEGVHRELALVDWNVANQSHWNTRLQPWLLDTAKQRGPTTLEMYYVQEDLWVLETLLNIVQRTNGGADNRSDAAIKSLEYIYMGPDLAQLLADPTAGEEGTEASGGYPTGNVGNYAPGSEYGNEGQGAASIDPADNRYVDRDYRPLSGKAVRSVYQEADPTKAYLRVAKRVPIQMRFTISHKRLPAFLAECANSPLVVEVREVQINRPARGSASGSEGYGTGVSRNSSYGATSSFGGLQAGMNFNTSRFAPPGGSPGSGARPGSSASYEGESAGGLPSAGSQDVPVEVFGIVLIYNPVDRKTLEVAPEEAEDGNVAIDRMRSAGAEG